MPAVELLLVAWITCAAIGYFLGSTVKKEGTGFFLGLLLGPIGWIIVLLLPRESQQSDNSNSSQQNLRKTLIEQSTRSYRPERDLTSDAYKIWLVETYEIKKNEVFEKYVCNETLFETLDDSLVYADSLEAEKRSDEEIEAEKERLKKAQEESRPDGVDEALPENSDELPGNSNLWNVGIILLFASIIAVGVFLEMQP